MPIQVIVSEFFNFIKEIGIMSWFSDGCEGGKKLISQIHDNF